MYPETSTAQVICISTEAALAGQTLKNRKPVS
jgi:hypothetical protein